ncbi:hypothetical protein B1F79_03475 [Coxiella-like endosymbiont of Rhipicephalus sanguineus]|uniref:hypothetical protein n=1 Tax=Coxiella-like endosymbiont of Rhipicephalus sanguineus TaxID=1955402 RepID=UPI002040DC9D|nr:hypothetical protein [Coxiella-like endosymbiont of Rhipicephalus sanguineus]MBT8506591.1 hypothetical protein [Coxiella-like endosymbiont of Rhipicephalus sanguineus]
MDGNTVLTGGHNLRTHEYLENSLVYDFSIEIHGQAKLAADRFVNQLQRYICKHKETKSEIIADLQSYFHGQYQEAFLLNFDIKKLSDQLYQGNIAVMALA